MCHVAGKRVNITSKEWFGFIVEVGFHVRLPCVLILW